MFEDEEEFSLGYGNAQELMPQDPMAAQGGAPAGAPGAEGDPIMQGVQAFMETQDPQIAVEVVTMLAEQMGLSAAAPAPAPGGNGGMGAGPAQAPAPAPMGRNGMTVKPKLY